MSATIMQALSHLLDIQQRLNEIAFQKTELLKNNEVQKLEELLKEEEEVVHALEQAELEREKTVATFLKHRNINIEDTTLSALYTYLSAEEKEQFDEVQMQLVEQLVQLQKQNELNEQLTRQSLYFINASLSMVSPEENVAGTYERPHQKKSDQGGSGRRSIFDTKA